MATDRKVFKVVVADFENIRSIEESDDEKDINFIKQALEDAGLGRVEVTLE